MIVNIDGPVHEHDCDDCTYLGSVAPIESVTGDQPADLYACSQAGNHLVYRTGKYGDYVSMRAEQVAESYFGPVPSASVLAPLFRELFTRAAAAGVIRQASKPVTVIEPVGPVLKLYDAISEVLDGRFEDVHYARVQDSLVVELKDPDADPKAFAEKLTAVLAQQLPARTVAVSQQTILG